MAQRVNVSPRKIPRQERSRDMDQLILEASARVLEESGPAATTLENRVRQLEYDFRRVERERDILKKALAIFSQRM